jgi:hypothetical protein
MFEMEGYVWVVVVETDGVEVTYRLMRYTEGEGLDSNDEGEVASEEEVLQLIMDCSTS